MFAPYEWVEIYIRQDSNLILLGLELLILGVVEII